jgi:glutamate racemase
MTSLHAALDQERPIGVFDSGFGGLTVARSLARRLPHESILYFGDTARVPYGSKSPDIVRRFSREAARFLRSRDIKLLVIACNTATAHAEAMLADELDIPVVGVIEPGAAAAVAATRTGRIGVLGTAGTIASGAYDLAVRRRLGEGGRVYAQPCPLFVPLVEEGWTDHPVVRSVVSEYLGPLKAVDVDVVVLGCTHYPLIHAVLQDEVGPDVRLVDSGEETAATVASVLEQHHIEAPSTNGPSHSFFVSDSPLRFREFGRRFSDGLVDAVAHVDIDGFGLHLQRLDNRR